MLKISTFFKKLSISKLPPVDKSNDLNESFDSNHSNESTEKANQINGHTTTNENFQTQIEQLNEYIDPAWCKDNQFSFQFKPIQPSLSSYPANDKGQRFNSVWFTEHWWLEYSKSKNAAFCFVFRYFGQNSSNSESVYTKEGFTNFRKAKRKFKEHEESKSHKTAELMYNSRAREGKSVTYQLSSYHEKQAELNRTYFTTLF